MFVSHDVCQEIRSRCGWRYNKDFRGYLYRIVGQKEKDFIDSVQTRTAWPAIRFRGCIFSQTPDEAGTGICSLVKMYFGVTFSARGMVDFFELVGLSYTRSIYTLKISDFEKQEQFWKTFENSKNFWIMLSPQSCLKMDLCSGITRLSRRPVSWKENKRSSWLTENTKGWNSWTVWTMQQDIFVWTNIKNMIRKFLCGPWKISYPCTRKGKLYSAAI